MKKELQVVIECLKEKSNKKKIEKDKEHWREGYQLSEQDVYGEGDK